MRARQIPPPRQGRLVAGGEGRGRSLLRARAADWAAEGVLAESRSSAGGSSPWRRAGPHGRQRVPGLYRPQQVQQGRQNETVAV